ncbi:MAG: transglycosylase SLT domain-containing protein [Tannerellaceae bacterium]|jgi:membrane-bound lytic murein transglycosylase F|nr:transglycosylase SLT domain-containing protein [Tannerellaceae bacterium]
MNAYKLGILLLGLILLGSCRQPPGPKEEALGGDDLPQIREKGLLTAVTLYGSTSYFLYRMEPMGYEYERIRNFATANELKLEVKVADNLSRMLEMLAAGEADVVAYPVVFTRELKRQVLYCGRPDSAMQVLVQPLRSGMPRIKDVTEMIGKDIYVTAETPFHQRLGNLNDELGGGLRIHAVEGNTTSEDLIEQVAAGKIPYTVTDDRTARLNKTYYRNLDVGLQVSFLQRSSWVVRTKSPQLAEAINAWANRYEGESSYQLISKRYFELNKRALELSVPEIKHGNISPYDSLFRKYAETLGWDWRLLASLAYQESHFRNTETSWAGAQGLMGIMPGTAETLKIAPHELMDPEVNIRAGVEVLRRFGQGFGEVADSAERVKLTLASYNAGIGHVYDAQRLALKYGKNPAIWDDNVAEYVRLKHEPTFYNDSLCRFGYLRGKETFNYVREILGRYEYYRRGGATERSR